MIIAIKSIYRNIFKALLNSVGISIGIFSVLIINALSNYGIDSAQKTLDRMGINGYVITSNTITEDDIAKLNICPSIKNVSPIIKAVSYQSDNNSINIVGGDSDLKIINSLKLVHGEFFNTNHLNSIEPVCVVSSNYAIERFGTDKCIGQQIVLVINGFSQLFNIIGVYKSDSIIEASGINNEPIYAPYTVLSSMLSKDCNSIIIMPNSSNNSLEGEINIRSYCNSVWGENYYKLNNIANEREKINTLMTIIKNILAIIVCVSLVVSIMGLMVIMIINVKSKAGEIGLKKAIGASNLSIISETCIEAGLTSFLGLLHGYTYFILLKIILSLLNFHIYADFKIILYVILLTILSSMLVGLIPAYLAARIDPAKALKID